jgi:hypothetical protein
MIFQNKNRSSYKHEFQNHILKLFLIFFEYPNVFKLALSYKYNIIM